MTRPRGKHIKVFVTEEERETITRKAAGANLSLSSYLRAAGLNHSVRSVMDVYAVTELSKVNGELGRVAELLKVWLALGGEDAPGDIKLIMKEFRELQKQSHEIMGRMLR